MRSDRKGVWRGHNIKKDLDFYANDTTNNDVTLVVQNNRHLFYIFTCLPTYLVLHVSILSLCLYRLIARYARIYNNFHF